MNTSSHHSFTRNVVTATRGVRWGIGLEDGIGTFVVVVGLGRDVGEGPAAETVGWVGRGPREGGAEGAAREGAKKGMGEEDGRGGCCRPHFEKLGFVCVCVLGKMRFGGGGLCNGAFWVE